MKNITRIQHAYKPDEDKSNDVTKGQPIGKCQSGYETLN